MAAEPIDRRTLLARSAALGGFVGLGAVGGRRDLSTSIEANSRHDQGRAVIGTDRDVEYASGGARMAASLRLPASRGRLVPAAVIVAGSGPTDRNGNSPLITYPGTSTPVLLDPYRWIADQLSAAGVASLRYDKLGIGATGLGTFAADPKSLYAQSFDDTYVQGARDSLAFLAAQPGVDPTRLLLIGHSEGGMITLAVAQHPGNAPRPAGLALIEPQYGRILSILERQYSDVIRGLGLSAADTAILLDWLAAGVVLARTGPHGFFQPGPLPLPDAPPEALAQQNAINQYIYGLGRTEFLSSQDAIDPVAIAGQIHQPVLITAGTKDFATPLSPGGPPGSGVAALAAAFPSKVADLVVLPDTDHELRNVGDAVDPIDPGNGAPADFAALLQYPFSSVLADALVQFTQRWTRADRGR